MQPVCGLRPSIKRPVVPSRAPPAERAPPRKYDRIMQPVCGLRPSIKRPVVPSRTPPAERAPPRKYGRIMQPICKKNRTESELSAIFLANVHFLLYRRTLPWLY